MIPEIGMLLGVKLSNNEFGIAHIGHVEIIDKTYCITCGFYNKKFPNLKTLKGESFSNEYLSKPFMICSISSEEIEKGIWSVISKVELEYKNVDIQNNLKFGLYKGKEEPGIMLLEMFLGILPWDLLYDPEYLDKLLLPGIKRPEKIFFKSK